MLKNLCTGLIYKSWLVYLYLVGICRKYQIIIRYNLIFGEETFRI